MKLEARVGAAALAVATFASATPALAFAEEGGGGVDILIPKMAEFIPALIAFIIIWIVMAKFAMPQVMGMMDKRSEKIAGDLKTAEDEKLAAVEQRKVAESIVTDARRQAADIVLEARRDAEEERTRIVAAAHDEAADIIAKAHANVEDERRAVVAKTTETVANLSVDVAAKIIGDALTADEQKRLVEKYLEEAGSLNAD